MSSSSSSIIRRLVIVVELLSSCYLCRRVYRRLVIFVVSSSSCFLRRRVIIVELSSPCYLHRVIFVVELSSLCHYHHHRCHPMYSRPNISLLLQFLNEEDKSLHTRIVVIHRLDKYVKPPRTTRQGCTDIASVQARNILSPSPPTGCCGKSLFHASLFTDTDNNVSYSSDLLLGSTVVEGTFEVAFQLWIDLCVFLARGVWSVWSKKRRIRDSGNVTTT